MSSVPDQVVVTLCSDDFLELRHQLEIGRLDGVGGENPDFGGLRGA